MRRGLNRTEVMIIVVIAGSIVALLLPAVGLARKASWRTVCRNNLKQHAIGLHNYRDTNGRFPPGTMPNPDLSPEQRLSFHAALLPYMECDDLYKLLARNEAWDSDRNAGLLAHRSYRVYQCPVWISWHDADPHLVGSGHLAATHYVGVVGVGADAATRPADAPGIGMFGYDRGTKTEDVKDGLANTLMLTETAHDASPWIRGGAGTVRAVGVDDGQFGGTHFRTAFLFRTRPAEDYYAAMGDATVRLVKTATDPALLAALATVAGGEDIPTDW